MAQGKKTLTYRNRFVKNLNQVLSDRFDDIPLLPALPFMDMSSRHPLVFRLNQDEYTKMYSALSIGAELMYPDESHELMYIFEAPDDYEPEEDFCLDYQTDDATIITFAPQDPHTEPDLTPDGYLMPPFWVVGDVLPEFLPDWFAELITDIIEQFTGYEDDDVLTTIGSFPILANWSELLTNGLPRFTITVPTSGKVQLHLLSVPLGGRLLVSVDIEPNIPDIIAGIIDEGFKIIELERDFSSQPPELDVDHIEEIILEDNEPHVIYCTFLPVVDIDAIPLKFGGGIRKVVWCPDEIPDEPCEECPEPEIEELLADDEFFETEYIPATFGTKYSTAQTRNTSLTTAYDGTPQSIGSQIPVGAPTEVEKNALCYALSKFVALYCSEKTCLIQSRSFGEVAYDALEDAAEAFYGNVLDDMLGAWSDNLFGCVIDTAAGLAALADTAAQEDLACFLYDVLDGVAISESGLTNAIDTAATTLTGNAQDIACVMTEDMAEVVYLNFLQAYNTALIQQAEGIDKPCPCTTATYKLWTWDFRTQGQWESTLDYQRGVNAEGTFVAGSGWQAINIAGGGRAVSLAFPLDPAWEIRTVAIRTGGTGTINARSVLLRPTIYSNVGATTLNMSNGTGEYNHCRVILTPAASGLNQWAIRFTLPNQTTTLFVEKIAVLYNYAHAAPSSIPSEDSNLCD